MKRIHWTKIATLSLLVTATVVFLFLLFRREPIEDTALRYTVAAIEGDSKTLLESSFPHEREKTGLTKERLAFLWDNLVLPRLKGCKQVGQPSLVRYGGTSRLRPEIGEPHEGAAYIVLKDPQGLTFEMAQDAWATEDGPRAEVLGTLRGIWVIQFAVRKGLPLTRENVIRAWIEGCRHDLPVLEASGVKGFVGNKPDSRVHPWREFASEWERELAKTSSS